MKDKLSLEQVQKVLGISYPTALARAKVYGTFENTPPSGKWYIDSKIIRLQLEGALQEAQDRLALLEKIESS